MLHWIKTTFFVSEERARPWELSDKISSKISKVLDQLLQQTTWKLQKKRLFVSQFSRAIGRAEINFLLSLLPLKIRFLHLGNSQTILLIMVLTELFRVYFQTTTTRYSIPSHLTKIGTKTTNFLTKIEIIYKVLFNKISPSQARTGALSKQINDRIIKTAFSEIKTKTVSQTILSQVQTRDLEIPHPVIIKTILYQIKIRTVYPILL